jgi:hypothetical protein
MLREHFTILHKTLDVHPTFRLLLGNERLVWPIAHVNAKLEHAQTWLGTRVCLSQHPSPQSAAIPEIKLSRHTFAFFQI